MLFDARPGLCCAGCLIIRFCSLSTKTLQVWNLPQLFIQGRAPIDMLRGGQYTYQENVRKIAGKGKLQFSIPEK